MVDDNLYIFTVVVFYIWSLRSIFYWVNLWQNLRYQPKIFIRSPQARGRIGQYLFSFSSALSWLWIVGALFITIDDKPIIFYQLAVFAIFLGKTFFVIHDILTSRIQYSGFSLRSFTIMILSTFTLSFLFMFPLTEKFLWLLILDRLLFFIVNSFVLFFSFPSEIYDDMQVKKAIAEIKKKKSLIPLILTGSPQARITAHFLSQVLQKHFTTLSIVDEQLTQQQLSSAFLKNISTQCEIIIMASEKPQDLSWIKYFFIPKIGTVFDPEPLTSREKKAYLASLLLLFSQKSKLFLDEKVKQLLPEKKFVRQNIFFFSSQPDITQKKSHLTIRVVLPSSTMELRAPLISGHISQSLVVTVAIAHILGLTQKQIRDSFLSLQPLPKVCVYHQSTAGIVFIDNTKNTSLEVVGSLNHYLSLFKKARFLVLGRSNFLSTEKNMRKLSGFIAKQYTHVILLPTPARFRLKKMIKLQSSNCIVRDMNTRQATSYTQSHIGKGDVVVFEGEDADHLFHTLYNSYASNA